MTYLEALDLLSATREVHGLRHACEHGPRRERYRAYAIHLAGGHAPEPEPESKARPEPPPLRVQVRTLGKAVARFVAKGCPTVAPEEYERRRAICLPCDQYDPAKERCGKCGCSLKVKPWMGTEKCPVGKW